MIIEGGRDDETSTMQGHQGKEHGRLKKGILKVKKHASGGGGGGHNYSGGREL